MLVLRRPPLFYRSPKARSLTGSGLGLAIVRQIAETYGGTVEARTPASGGTSLSLALPPLTAPPNDSSTRATTDEGREDMVIRT